MHVVRGLSSASVLCRATNSDGYRSGSEAFRDRNGGFYVHFAPWDKPKPGDLVMGESGRVCDWLIAWYVEPPKEEYGYHVVREIGTGQLCNYGNERFSPIRGLTETQLLEGEQYKFYIKVLRAFGGGDEYLYRFGGLRFDGQTAYVAVREAFGGFAAKSIPFEVEVPFNKKISVKAILAAMRAQGYGTRKFEHEPQAGPPKPTTVIAFL